MCGLVMFHLISKILSEVPTEVWDIVVREEPEWRHMSEFLSSYGFGKFAVLMVAAGLNDFQLKGRAEVAYWPRLRNLLRRHAIPGTLSELESILAEFYSRERLPDLKLRRLRRFLSSRLAKWLWSAEPTDIAKNFLRIWYELAITMNQDRKAKTIAFAMKCLGIALLMAGVADFDFEEIPIPVDFRVREFTRKIGVKVSNDEDVRSFWRGVLEDLKKIGVRINMIYLDSLIWQIGTLSRHEVREYFRRLGLGEVGEKMAEVMR